MQTQPTVRKYYYRGSIHSIIAILKIHLQRTPGYYKHISVHQTAGCKRDSVFTCLTVSCLFTHNSEKLCLVVGYLLSVFLPAVTQQNHQENSHQCNASYCYLQLFKIIRVLEMQANFDLFQISLNIRLLFAVP